MAMAITLQQYLEDHDVEYDVVTHPRTLTSSETAEICHVSGDCIAKGVVLKGEEDYWLAVVPASHHVRMGEVQKFLRRPVGLATEAEMASLFPDCDIGAVPPVGSAYGLNVVVDESLNNQDDLFFECGDHCNLVHVTREQFHRLMKNAPHGRISDHD